MKKSVVAAAVAAVLAVPAVAMAEVSISGGLQAELRSVGGDGTLMPKGLYATDGGQAGSENGGNYGFLKFSAAENLGGGLKALAVYDMDISVGDTTSVAGNKNGTSPSGREAYVGLAGGWGAILAGTASTPYKSSTVGWDPFLATSLQARGNGGMSSLQNGYASNAVAYAGSFSGVKVVAAIALDEATNGTDGTKTNGKNAYSFSVNAPIGPVELAVAYIDVSKDADLIGSLVPAYSGTTTAANLDNLSAAKVGLKWTSGAWTVAGQVEQLAKGFSSDNSAHDVTYLTASYAMGNNTISAGYGVSNKNLTAVALGFTPAGDKDPSYVALGLKHAFSKTVSTFVGYEATDAGTNAKQDTISVGLRVGF